MPSAKIIPHADDEEYDGYDDPVVQPRRSALVADRRLAYKYMFKIFKLIAMMNLIAMGVVVVFVVCRLAISHECPGRPTLVVPNFLWYALWDYGYLFALGGTVVVTGRNLVSPSRMQLSTFEMVLIVGVFVFSCVVPVGIFLTVLKNPGLIRVGRMGAVVAMLSVYFYIARRQARKLKSPVADVSVRARFRSHHDRLVIALLKFATAFFIGYYCALSFSDRSFSLSFPRIVERVNTNSELNWMAKMTVEVGLVSVFYSVFFPFWSKFLGRYVQELCCLYSFNVHSSKEITVKLTDIDADDRCAFYDGDGTNLTTQQLALTTENVLAASMLVINFWLDITRFVYGRGILFKLSSIHLFFLVVFKDFCYQVWHFGFKYVDWVLVFTLKTFHSEGLGKMSRFWHALSVCVELVVRIGGIPKALCAAWILPVDYASLKHRDGEKTKCTVKLAFCNVSIKLSNLPESFKEDLLQASHKIKTDLQVIDTDLSATSDDLRTKQLDRRGERRSDAVSDIRSSMSAPPVLYSIPVEKLKLPPTCKGGRRLSIIGEDPPVTEEEKYNFKDVVSIIQANIFMRYQVRAASKTFTALVFLFIPFVARFTPTRYHAYFSDFDFFGDEEISTKYRIAAITFFVVDLCEWVMLTVVHIRKTEFAAPMVRYLHGLLISRCKPLTVMCVFAAFSGVFLFQMKWNPFTMDVINVSLGHNAENAWTDWATAYEQCFS